MAKSSAKSPAGRRAREGPRRNTARSCPITSALSASAGRTLNERDTATAEKAVVVNEAFVKDYLADVANPLGQRVYIGKMFGFEQPWRIVGVVSDARQFNLSQNLNLNASWNRRAFVPSGCEPLLFSWPKSVRSISVIGVESGVLTVVV